MYSDLREYQCPGTPFRDGTEGESVGVGTEIQDFAAELSGLKERSGLSYGTLAQKLHMSTSTVHRYCNGDAVPHDYAPVERFARVCRASADELVRLHRKWILADEAKRRGTRKAEAGAGAGAGEGVPAPPERGPEPEPEPEPQPRPRAEPEPESELEPQPGAEPDHAVPDVTAEVPSGTRAPSSRRLRVLLAAAAVVALTVPTAWVINRDTGADRVDDGRLSAASVHPSAEPLRSVAASVSPSPSPSPDKSSASATPSARAGKSTAPGEAGGKGGAGAHSRGVPVAATISSYNWESPCGQYYLLDRDPGTVVPPPPPQDRRSWARALGGVDGGDMKLELTIQGISQEAVVLHGLHVRVLSRNAPLEWSSYSMGEGCGGGITPQSFDIDLDEGRPRSKPVAGEDRGAVVPAKDFPYRVSSTDVEVFDVNAHVEGHDVTWYLELEWSSGDQSGTLRIDDNGEPFRTSSTTGRPGYTYWPDKAQWVVDDNA